MYRFLDRPVADLDPTHRFLLAGMRLWVAATGSARAHHAPVARAFAQAGTIDAAGDFAIAMRTLEEEDGWIWRLAVASHRDVTEDEARLLALFDAGLAGRAPLVRRLAAGLVSGDAVGQLALAVELAAMRLTGGVMMERDR